MQYWMQSKTPVQFRLQWPTSALVKDRLALADIKMPFCQIGRAG
jgi:hypothetical protein